MLYIRYVDDLAVLSNDKGHLHGTKERIGHFLHTLRLKLHPRKSVVFPARVGTDFLGYRIYPTHTRIRRDNVKRFVARTRLMQHEYAQGNVPLDKVRASIHNWLGHAKHADSYRLCCRLMEELSFVRSNTH